VYVCLCRVVTDREIIRAIDEGAQSLRQVARRCGAGTVCGGCRPAIEALVRKRLGGQERADGAEVIPLDAAMEGER
jgi:bacterioferritin-associated ferredoxin